MRRLHQWCELINPVATIIFHVVFWEQHTKVQMVQHRQASLANWLWLVIGVIMAMVSDWTGALIKNDKQWAKHWHYVDYTCDILQTQSISANNVRSCWYDANWLKWGLHFRFNHNDWKIIMYYWHCQCIINICNKNNRNWSICASLNHFLNINF